MGKISKAIIYLYTDILSYRCNVRISRIDPNGVYIFQTYIPFQDKDDFVCEYKFPEGPARQVPATRINDYEL